MSRGYVFIFLNIYGMGKIMGGQFYRKGQLPEEVASLTLAEADAFSLAWTFMGYSYGYILFVGILQLIGAWMLLWDKTKIFGAMVLIPIMANIIVFDIFFLDKKGALANASIYFLLLFLILLLNKERVFRAIRMLIGDGAKPFGVRNYKTYLAAGLLMALLFCLDQFLVQSIGH